MIDKNVKEFIDNNCITPDFPIKGVNFVDVFPMMERYYLEDHRVLTELAELYPIVIMPEARGFLFYDCFYPNALPLRKKGKLPGKVEGITYQKEYGPDTIYYQEAALKRILDKYYGSIPDKYLPSAINIAFFDDIAATFGTANAICDHFNTLTYRGVPIKVKEAIFYLRLVTEFPDAHKYLEDKGIKVTSIHEY